MRKDNLCYEHSKKRESLPNQNNKRTSHFDQKRKGFESNKIFGNNSKNFSKNYYQREDFKNKVPQNTTTPKGKDMPNNFVKNNEHKEPVKSWECQVLSEQKKETSATCIPSRKRKQLETWQMKCQD